MVYLESLERDHLAILKKWRNQPFVKAYCREYRLLNQADQEAWYDSYLRSRRSSEWDQEIYLLYYSALHCDEPTPVGVGGFTRIQWRNRRAELTFYIGNLELRSRETVRCALATLLNVGFMDFGFHKVTWPVFGHDPNIKWYLDFLKEEAVLKEEYFWDGRFYDRHYLSLTRGEYDKRVIAGTYS